MARAGKEPAEDVKRAMRRAIGLAGLIVHNVSMLPIPELEGRVVHATANPEGWPHELPAIELLVKVGFNGSISEVSIRCSASDGDPLQNVFLAPKLQKCSCRLVELSTTLKEVWVSRHQVIDRLKSGETPPIFDGHWTWSLPDLELPNAE